MDNRHRLRTNTHMETTCSISPRMDRVGGLDLGGSKIEARLFAPDWRCLETRRWPTPPAYGALLDALEGAHAWLRSGGAGRIGLAHPGIVSPMTGRVRAANLAIHGRPFASDLHARLGRPVAHLNDAQAMALSEARLGAGRGMDPVAGLIVGTGLSAGLVSGGRALGGWRGAAGEIGHTPLPAALVARHGLPLVECGCGAAGCYETLGSGGGLERLGRHLTGRSLGARDWAADAGVLDVWADILGALCRTMCRVWDPQVIVLGGGASRTPQLDSLLAAKIADDPLGAGALPEIRLAQGNDASGARGAALHAADETA